MSIITVDQQKCRKDGLCAAVCPRGIIEIEIDQSYPRLTEDATEQCITCGHCSAICPHQALSLEKLPPETWPQYDYSFLPSEEQLYQLIRGRRSIRTYRETPVARESIERLINLARYAPTARNSQQIQWLVIDNPSELETLTNHTIDWIKDCIENHNPIAIAYDFESILKAYDNGTDPLLRGAPGLIVLHAPKAYPIGLIDSTIAMTTFELAASAEQIGTCWAGFLMIAMNQWTPLQDALKLPVENIPTTALMIGYPQYRYFRMPERSAPIIQWR